MSDTTHLPSDLHRATQGPLLQQRIPSGSAAINDSSGSPHAQHYQYHSNTNNSLIDNEDYDDKVATRRSRIYRWIVILIMSISGDGWSYEASVMSSVLNLPTFLHHMGYEKELPNVANMLIGPIYSLGQLIGGLIGGYIADTFGRKMTLILGTTFTLLSTSLLIWAPDVYVLIGARVIQGAAIGLLILGFQVYTAEVASKNERGMLSGTSLVSGNLFSTFAAAIAFGVTYTTGNWGWRLSLAVSFIPSVVLLMLLPFVPETPRYHYQKGREAKAREVMVRFHGTRDGKLTAASEAEFDAMIAAIKYDQEASNIGWSAFVNTPAARFRTFCALSSQLIWPWAGQSVWTYYFGRVYRYAGITEDHTSFAINLALSVAMIFTSLFGSWLSDQIGRRLSFLIGIGQAVAFMLVQWALAVLYLDSESEIGSGSGSVVGYVFVSCYFVSQLLWVAFFSPVVYLYLTELFPGPLRARGFALGNAVSMLAGFVAMVTAAPTMDALKGWVCVMAESFKYANTHTHYITHMC
eukprot:TRINITY_DN8987_c0_g1_i2.p1 TRINITY_DN8987_c0_g1~~TRINITY_DN8987_c0_g1_i2.p1  ORF type:complete len:522 (-),score=70.69 TRINITY_DN8987_c0_g1_i2:67-1632(-)